MTSMDKAAIGWSIAIVAAGVAFAFAGQGLQDAPPTPVSAPVMEEPKTDPLAEIADKVKEDKPRKVGYERVTSIQDPGVGHESHQLAILIPPGDEVYTGTLIYDASENIQLVALNGPLVPGEEVEKTWTPDGETIFALTFVDPENSKGEWKFSGNALAVHTMFTTPFVVDYKIIDLQEVEMEAEEEIMEMEHEEMEMEHEEMEMEHEEMEMASDPQTVLISMPAGTSVPGCEETDECYIPASVSINVGDTVSWVNDDTAAHTVTSGTPADGPSGVFDSSLVMGGAVYEYTFNEAGSFDYFCMVHPWMVGNVSVS